MGLHRYVLCHVPIKAILRLRPQSDPHLQALLTVTMEVAF